MIVGAGRDNGLDLGSRLRGHWSLKGLGGRIGRGRVRRRSRWRRGGCLYRRLCSR